jgi:hypothetical protein
LHDKTKRIECKAMKLKISSMYFAKTGACLPCDECASDIVEVYALVHALIQNKTKNEYVSCQ